MKRMVNILGILIMILVLTACSNPFLKKSGTVMEAENLPHVEVIEEETVIPNENVNESDNTEENVDNLRTVVICSGDMGRGRNVVHYYFENDRIYKYVSTLEIPEQYDAEEFYVSEQIMNSGRYEMRLEGRTIFEELDPSMPFWNEWPYKDETYTRIYKIWTEYGYSCEG